MAENELETRWLKQEIFRRYPDLTNTRPLAWSGGLEVPTNKIVDVAVVPRLKFDGYHHLPVHDVELREVARRLLRRSARFCCLDNDAILVLAVLQ